KSTVARALAQRLGWRYLDTGAMYRAVTLTFQRAGVSGEAPDAELGARLPALGLTFDDAGQPLLDGRPLGAELRDPAVEAEVSAFASRAPVRAFLRDVQRRLGTAAPTVAEGRDMASVVFPDAAWKVWLDASLEERARRRSRDFRARGRAVEETAVAAEIAARDARDAQRALAPLQRTADALVV